MTLFTSLPLSHLLVIFLLRLLVLLCFLLLILHIDALMKAVTHITFVIKRAHVVIILVHNNPIDLIFALCCNRLVLIPFNGQ